MFTTFKEEERLMHRLMHRLTHRLMQLLPYCGKAVEILQYRAEAVTLLQYSKRRGGDFSTVWEVRRAVQIAERKGDVVEYSRGEARLLKHSKVKEEEESRLKQYSTY